MKLSQTIKELSEEMKHLDVVIATLEAIERPGNAEAGTHPGDLSRGLRPRGRKSMGSEERQRVSERMRAYWASRRNSQGSGTEAQEEPSPAASTCDSETGYASNSGADDSEPR